VGRGDRRPTNTPLPATEQRLRGRVERLLRCAHRFGPNVSFSGAALVQVARCAAGRKTESHLAFSGVEEHRWLTIHFPSESLHSRITYGWRSIRTSPPKILLVPDRTQPEAHDGV